MLTCVGIDRAADAQRERTCPRAPSVSVASSVFETRSVFPWSAHATYTVSLHFCLSSPSLFQKKSSPAFLTPAIQLAAKSY